MQQFREVTTLKAEQRSNSFQNNESHKSRFCALIFSITTLTSPQTIAGHPSEASSIQLSAEQITKPVLLHTLHVWPKLASVQTNKARRVPQILHLQDRARSDIDTIALISILQYVQYTKFENTPFGFDGVISIITFPPPRNLQDGRRNTAGWKKSIGWNRTLI